MRPSKGWLVVVSWLAACGGGGSGDPDAAPGTDAAPTADAAPDATACVPAAEVCNDVDDDCDGVVDDDPEASATCAFPNATGVCTAGICGLGTCTAGYVNCDGDLMNGCELDVAMASCVCTPATIISCYSGDPGTLNVGACIAGMMTCLPTGTGYGPCEGEVLPVTDACGNGIDDDCSGTVDDPPDLDGDGWTTCTGDCCDAVGDGCTDPVRVNPGAFEIVGNGFDDDCAMVTDDTMPAPTCSPAPVFTGVTATALTQAMDLCQTTTPADQTWGVLSAELVNADGSALSMTAGTQVADFQAAVLGNYGTGGVVPERGMTMAGISTGRMRDANDVGYVAPNPGTNHGRLGSPPAGYLAANGGSLPSSQGCSGNCPAGAGANDSVNLALTIRVPTNASALAYSFRFFSAEYWQWSCDLYNDHHLALLATGAPGIPADGNIAFDSINNPVSVNSGYFDICQQVGCHTCPLGIGPLIGTGMDMLVGSPSGTGRTGGGTEWLWVTAPVVPGEIITLQILVFDVQDASLDSNVLLDDFRWMP